MVTESPHIQTSEFSHMPLLYLQMATNSSNTCVLCEKENESSTHVVSEKGFNTLIKCCIEQQMSDIHQELTRRYNI